MPILNDCIEQVIKYLDETLKVKNVNESDTQKVEIVIGNNVVG